MNFLKLSRYLLIVITFYCFSPILSANQLMVKIDSCFKLYDEWPNPDSVMVDTCQNSDTYRDYFAKRTYVFSAKPGIYFFKERPLPYFSDRTWEDIDTIYPEVKEKFRNMEVVFGKYVFQRGDFAPDPEALFLGNVFIFFKDYQHVKNVFDYLKTIPMVNGYALYDFPHRDTYCEPNTTNKDIILKNDVLNRDVFINTRVLVGKIEIFDVLGNSVFKSSLNIQENSNIDVSYLPSGLYFVLINNSIFKIFIMR